MQNSNQDILGLQGLDPTISLVKRKSHKRGNSYKISLICWNRIKTIFG